VLSNIIAFSTGIKLAGGDDRVIGVTVTGNETGISLASEHNLVDRNKVSGNAVGISALLGATHNTIVNNYSSNQFFDLFDGNPNCDNNKWRTNDFRIANQSCIQ
jgi:Periplasmic copper-binding protein (NosD)